MESVKSPAKLAFFRDCIKVREMTTFEEQTRKPDIQA